MSTTPVETARRRNRRLRSGVRGTTRRTDQSPSGATTRTSPLQGGWSSRRGWRASSCAGQEALRCVVPQSCQQVPRAYPGCNPGDVCKSSFARAVHIPWLDSDSRDSPPRVATTLAPQQAGAAEALIDTDASSHAQCDWDSCPAEYVSGPPTVLSSRDDLDRVNSKSVRSTITEAARRTVAAEGPIGLDRLAQDIGRRFGYDRVSAARKSSSPRACRTHLSEKDRWGSSCGHTTST